MGLFGKLLKKKTWETFQTKGDALMERGEHGLALQEFRSASKRFDGDDEAREALDGRIAAVRGALKEVQLERFRKYLAASAWERAEGALESALGHCLTERERETVAKLGVQLAKAQRGGGGGGDDDLRKHLPDEALEPGRAHFVTLLGAMSDAQGDHYQTLSEHFRTGFVALHEGRAKDAVASLKKAREDHPDDGYVLAELGLAIVATSKLKEGFKLLREGESKVGDSVYLKLRLAQTAWFAEAFIVAEKALQEAHDLEPQNDEILTKIAEHSLLTDEYEAGIEAVEHLMEHSPRAGVRHIKLLAQLYLGKGDVEIAIGHLEQIMKLTTKLEGGQLSFDAETAMLLAQIYIREERRPERVVELLQPLLPMTKGPDHAGVLVTIAKALEIAGRMDESKAALQKALDALPRGDAKLRPVIERALSELDAK